jgi:hypothetical protein
MFVILKFKVVRNVFCDISSCVFQEWVIFLVERKIFRVEIFSQGNYRGCFIETVEGW